MLFDETVKWRILTKFFEIPEKGYYVNELARELNVSPGSISKICKELAKDELLRSQVKANALFYYLENNLVVVRKLKSAWFLNELMKYSECWENQEFQSVALYGSRSSGEFISMSDVDILVISNIPKTDVEKHFKKMKKLAVQVTITVFSAAEWRKLAKEKNRFYIEVIANNILIDGTSLVVG